MEGRGNALGTFRFAAGCCICDDHSALAASRGHSAFDVPRFGLLYMHVAYVYCVRMLDARVDIPEFISSNGEGSHALLGHAALGTLTQAREETRPRSDSSRRRGDPR